MKTWVDPASLAPSYDDDDDGNLLSDDRWTYKWDGENRLVSMTTKSTALSGGAPNVTMKFAYDWMGRRIGKQTNVSGSTFYHSYAYDHWNPVAEWKRTSLSGSMSAAGSLIRTHLWGFDIASTGKVSGSGAATAFQRAGGVAGLVASTHHHTSGDEHFILSYDANIIAWSDDVGDVVQKIDYDPFGNAVLVEDYAAVDKLPTFGFSTQPQDAESGLYYYGYRYYDPVTGRWPSRDPIEEEGGVNLYGFVRNDGVGEWDYLGQKKKPKPKQRKVMHTEGVDNEGKSCGLANVKKKSFYSILEAERFSGVRRTDQGIWRYEVEWECYERQCEDDDDPESDFIWVRIDGGEESLKVPAPGGGFEIDDGTLSFQSDAELINAAKTQMAEIKKKSAHFN